jgi:hypothetical protein
VPASSPKDAEYFVRWVDRVIEAAEARGGYNSDAEKRETLDYLGAARQTFAAPVVRRDSH